MQFSDFEMSYFERRVLRLLVRKARAQRIAEFGCGGTTSLLAQASQAEIVSWDNNQEWIDIVEQTMAGTPWESRVTIAFYLVTPEGDRAVEKAPPPYDGAQFDFVFLDGPRSAHPSSYGRHGSFRFAVQHTRDGGIIAWHDNDRPHEQQLARRFFGAFALHNWGRIGWCRKQSASFVQHLGAQAGGLLIRRCVMPLCEKLK